MKPILVAWMLCVLLASPALSELTPDDLDKIRLIVNESEKRVKEELKAELKAEIAKSEAQLKQYIDLKIQNVETQIRGVNDRVTLTVNLTYGLIALIVAAVGIPQIMLVWRSRSDSTLERRMETLVDKIESMAQDIEMLKQQRIARS